MSITEYVGVFAYAWSLDLLGDEDLQGLHP